MASYTVWIRSEGLFGWWWHVYESREHGFALTEKRARKKASKSILKYESAVPPRGKETWAVDDAKKYA